MPSSDLPRRRSPAAWVIAPLLLIVLTLSLAEIALRVGFYLFPPANYNLLPPDIANLHFFEPSTGNAFYAIKPNFQQKFLRDEFRIDVRTNNIGLREDTDYRGEAVDIGFIGDSYTFGWGVETGERYSDFVRNAFPGLKVLSYSYPDGHAPINYLSFLQARPELMPRVLVLGLFAFNDLASDTADAVVTERDGIVQSVGSRSLKVDEEGYIVARDFTPPRFPSSDWFARHTAVGRAVNVAYHRLRSGGRMPPKPDKFRPIDRGQWDETALQGLKDIQRIDELARQAGATLVVFYIPFPSYVGAASVCIYAPPLCARQRKENVLGEALGSWAVANGIRLIDPTETFRALTGRGQALYYREDGHWTVEGHAAAGRLIADYIEREGLLNPAPPAEPQH